MSTTLTPQDGINLATSLNPKAHKASRHEHLSTYDRFMRKVSPEPNTGCWLWNGQTVRAGYGIFWIDGTNYFAHQAAYMLTSGNRPPVKPLVLDHVCNVTCCVNPAHLQVVTEKENILRGNSAPSLNAKKTHCYKGHEFTPENTAVNKIGWRHCITCRREAAKRRGSWRTRSARKTA